MKELDKYKEAMARLFCEILEQFSPRTRLLILFCLMG